MHIGSGGGEAAPTLGELADQLRGLLGTERDPVATLANAAALVFSALPGLNWAGFYLAQGGELVLGPFQGRPACIRIAFGRGVCGTAASERRSVRVADVHAFPGHIACDAASRSELVIPLLDNAVVRGVLDLDSPRLDRFTATDQAGLEHLAAIVTAQIDWPASPWRA